MWAIVSIFTGFYLQEDGTFVWHGRENARKFATQEEAARFVGQVRTPTEVVFLD
jgi:hypothetical protein